MTTTRKPAISAGLVVVGGEQVAVRAGTQGIASSIDDVTLYGRSFRETVSSRVLERPRIERTIEGASAITIPLHDPEGELRRSALLSDGSGVDVELDGLWFTLTGRQRQGDVLTLSFRDREVTKLARRKGAKKARNDKVTIPQFARSLAKEAGVPFFCPDLDGTRPITDSKRGRENELSKRARREPGLAQSARFTIKGVRADAEQIRNCDRVLDVGRSMDVPRKVLTSSIATGIPESLCRNLRRGHLDSQGFFQQRPSQGWGPPGDLERDARDYYRAAMQVYRRDPNISIPALCQEVQRSGNPGAYAQYLPEAQRIVELYFGGVPATSTEQSVKPKQRKAPSRGPKENSWRCHGRLAEELDWRRYVSAGIEYFISELQMLASMPRMELGDDTPGVEKIDWSQTEGRPVTELTVAARAKSWDAPPGTVVDVIDQGSADGRFIVASIGTDLVKRNSLAEIKLKAPAAPDPEPVAEASTGGARSPRRRRAPARDRRGDAERMVEWLRGELGTSEGSSRQRRYASALGYSASLPWCSIFLGYGLKQVCGLPLPPNPAYSGAWLSWSAGRRISASKIQPGDLVVFDRGDGGMTDHVAAYVGHGNVIGGNQSDRVSKVPWDRGATVGVVRPDYRS